MRDSYHAERIRRAQSDAENARAARMVRLEDALHEVLALDGEVLTGEQRTALQNAAAAVREIRKVW